VLNTRHRRSHPSRNREGKRKKKKALIGPASSTTILFRGRQSADPRGEEKKPLSPCSTLTSCGRASTKRGALRPSNRSNQLRCADVSEPDRPARFDDKRRKGNRPRWRNAIGAGRVLILPIGTVNRRKGNPTRRKRTRKKAPTPFLSTLYVA